MAGLGAKVHVCIKMQNQQGAIMTERTMFFFFFKTIGEAKLDSDTVASRVYCKGLVRYRVVMALGGWHRITKVN